MTLAPAAAGAAVTPPQLAASFSTDAAAQPRGEPSAAAAQSADGEDQRRRMSRDRDAEEPEWSSQRRQATGKRNSVFAAAASKRAATKPADEPRGTKLQPRRVFEAGAEAGEGEGEEEEEAEEEVGEEEVGEEEVGEEEGENCARTRTSHQARSAVPWAFGAGFGHVPARASRADRTARVYPVPIRAHTRECGPDHDPHRRPRAHRATRAEPLRGLEPRIRAPSRPPRRLPLPVFITPLRVISHRPPCHAELECEECEDGDVDWEEEVQKTEAMLPGVVF